MRLNPFRMNVRRDSWTTWLLMRCSMPTRSAFRCDPHVNSTSRMCLLLPPWIVRPEASYAELTYLLMRSWVRLCVSALSQSLNGVSDSVALKAPDLLSASRAEQSSIVRQVQGARWNCSARGTPGALSASKSDALLRFLD